VLNEVKSHLDGRHDGFFDQQGHLRLEHAGHLDGIGLDVELLQLHRVFLASAGAPLERSGTGACFPGAASQRRYKGGPRPRGWHGLRTHREMRNETSSHTRKRDAFTRNCELVQIHASIIYHGLYFYNVVIVFRVQYIKVAPNVNSHIPQKHTYLARI